MNVKPPIDELDELQARSTRPIAERLLRVAQAMLGAGDFEAEAERLRNEILDAMQLADLLGRRRLMLEADKIRARRGNAEAARQCDLYLAGNRRFVEVARRNLPEGVSAALGPAGAPFEEMIADLLARSPRLARTADEVARFYSSTHAFAAIGAPSVQVADAVRRKIAELNRTGATLADAEQAIIRTTILQEITPWARSYAETVFRTNITTAYSAGRWKQVSDPVVREVIGAFRYDAVGDADTRPNHEAADGLIAGLADPIWEKFTPPLGYNCRCTIALVDRFELEELGLINHRGDVKRYTPPGFANAGPDSDRFGQGRPDRRLYGF